MSCVGDTSKSTMSRVSENEVQGNKLLIWGFTVIADKPLHLNCPCDSSYDGGWTDTYYADRELWETGKKHPPWQPGLTRVCRSIRADALPMFYQHNEFQAGYCYECDRDIVIDYLKVIGSENRKLMRHFFWFDANPKHDRNAPNDLKRIQRSAITREMGGRMQDSHSDDGCRHDVVFKPEDDEDLEALEGLFNGMAAEPQRSKRVRTIIDVKPMKKAEMEVSVVEVCAA